MKPVRTYFNLITGILLACYVLGIYANLIAHPPALWSWQLFSGFPIGLALALPGVLAASVASMLACWKHAENKTRIRLAGRALAFALLSMPFALFIFMTSSFRAEPVGVEGTSLPPIGPVGLCAFVASIGFSLTSLVLLLTWKPDAAPADASAGRSTIMDARPYPDWKRGLKVGGIWASITGTLMFAFCEFHAAYAAVSIVSMCRPFRPWYQLRNWIASLVVALFFFVVFGLASALRPETTAN